MKLFPLAAIAIVTLAIAFALGYLTNTEPKPLPRKMMVLDVINVSGCYAIGSLDDFEMKQSDERIASFLIEVENQTGEAINDLEFRVVDEFDSLRAGFNQPLQVQPGDTGTFYHSSHFWSIETGTELRLYLNFIATESGENHIGTYHKLRRTDPKSLNDQLEALGDKR